MVPPPLPPHLPGLHVVVLASAGDDPNQNDNKINVQISFISSHFEVKLTLVDYQYVDCLGLLETIIVDLRFDISKKTPAL